MTSMIENPSWVARNMTLRARKNPSPACKTGPEGATRGHACAMDPSGGTLSSCGRKTRKTARKVTL